MKRREKEGNRGRECGEGKRGYERDIEGNRGENRARMAKRNKGR